MSVAKEVKVEADQSDHATVHQFQNRKNFA